MGFELIYDDGAKFWPTPPATDPAEPAKAVAK
jgi:hypothetical protein